MAQRLPFVIAEIGVNHQGSFSHAKQLIQDAYHFGFDAVKLQHIDPKNIWHKSCPASFVLSEKETLPDGWIQALVSYAHSLGLQIGCTPTFQGSSSKIVESGFDFIKIASPQFKYDNFI